MNFTEKRGRQLDSLVKQEKYCMFVEIMNFYTVNALFFKFCSLIRQFF